MKVLVCSGDFLSWAIGQSIHTTSESRKVESLWVKVMHNTEKERDKIFYVKIQIGKNHGEEENPL